MSDFLKSFTAGLAQWPPQPTTVIGFGLIGGGIDFALTGSFAQAIIIAGLLKMLIPDSTPSGDALARITNMMSAAGSGAKAAVVAVALAAATIFSLSACSTSAQRDTTAVTEALKAGPAAEAVAYVAALHPEISAMLANVDATIAKDAPKALKYACGGGAMASFVLAAAEKLVPDKVPPALDAGARAGLADLNNLCGGATPMNLATVVRAALADYRNIFEAVKAAGVKVGA